MQERGVSCTFSVTAVDANTNVLATETVPQFIEGCEDFGMKIVARGAAQHGFVTAALVSDF